MIIKRAAKDRGHANHGWLDSYHTFSFASYYDAAHMGVSALRVINDDHVEPGGGFATHGHEDMEIISYVRQGTIEHKDNMGNIETLAAGEFQLMSAGTGITHSEYNPSDSAALKFLQIWVQPDQLGIEPGYQQKKFPRGVMQLIVSPDARDDSLLIHQDAYLYHVTLGANENTQLGNVMSRTLYVHMITGELEVEGEILSDGDGATVADLETLTLQTNTGAEALLFNLP